ncbi:O-antigen translocase [Aquipseudomonas alcaligenes]|uniref:LPS biosynthesis protein n=1 Tax=Aquipseudomonas alcaligenes TaxID=43263 RepID=A0AA37FNU9_AQUAC|nr:O-antigen translocase [Pseudomonas alcaligenes]BCR24076.1 LPS biosynthesis protein [Pseudomonas alcaligenes]GIZ66486.1 LPS biosynthesis protein [Pseudomonas alcaligenes]GIZ71090.1 LPS biosynthesis protein [Pseudomonas alcaligenes]GIZ75674.1 LPS biosynthesis protein [Pseudomonas alcaligenes]GIZ79735.1 LPS biosynthesis protein [Pseudomonas alcaligenes]
MTLIKTSLLNGIAVIVKMLTLLGLNKILAIYVGPAGYAALGQFQNAVQMITTLASGAINTGVTKYTAEYHEDEVKQQAVWRTAGTIALIGSLIVSVPVIIFNRHLASWFLKSEELGGVFVWFAATLVLFVFNTLLLAILNGKKEIQRYVVANIVGSLFALIITTAMAIKLGLYGALIALAVYQSLAFFVTLWMCQKTNWFRLAHFVGRIDRKAARNLAKFTAMSLTSAACVPISHILIRNHLGETLGWEAAGYWEAMWRLSAAYLMLVTTTLSVYYLPRIAELTDFLEIRKEILQGYKIILPVAAICGGMVYLLRGLIIRLLFTEEFSGMEVLFAWQMVGDTLKIGGWILAFVMLGKAMTKLFVVSEMLFSGLLYLLTIYLVGKMQLEGAAAAHALNYLLYWVFMIFFVGRISLRKM